MKCLVLTIRKWLICVTKPKIKIQEQSISMAIRDIGISLLESYGRKPEVPQDGVFPFIVYFESRSRGICVGSLVSRVAVLTAAVCVAGLNGELHDPRPITVVTGTRYRHPLRGIRMQVTKLVLPKLPQDIDARRHLLQKSVALLLLRDKVPDMLTEDPLRAVSIDYEGEETLALQDECVIMGWHFVYAMDNRRPPKPGPGWFLLHRHLHHQVLELAKDDEYCGELSRQYKMAADDLRHLGNFSDDDVMCFRDADDVAQPCHGMYGAPLVCRRGRVVALAAAPAAQWPRCDRRSVLLHKLSGQRNKDFFRCVAPLLEPEFLVNWDHIPTNTTDKNIILRDDTTNRS